MYSPDVRCEGCRFPHKLKGQDGENGCFGGALGGSAAHELYFMLAARDFTNDPRNIIIRCGQGGMTTLSHWACLGSGAGGGAFGRFGAPLRAHLVGDHARSRTTIWKQHIYICVILRTWGDLGAVLSCRSRGLSQGGRRVFGGCVFWAGWLPCCSGRGPRGMLAVRSWKYSDIAFNALI